MILGVPLGIVLSYIGARLLIRSAVDLTPVDRGPRTIQLFLFGLAVLISLPPFLLSLFCLDDSRVMLQDTFGSYIAGIFLAILLLVLLLGRDMAGMRLQGAVIALGTVFLTGISFTGYLSFDESVLMMLAMILIILTPYMADIWKSGVEKYSSDFEAARSDRSRGSSALTLAAGFLLILTGVAACILGMVLSAYDAGRPSQVVLAFIVGVIIAIVQALPSLILGRKGYVIPASMILIVCIFMNGLFAFLSVCFLPLTQI